MRLSDRLAAALKAYRVGPQAEPKARPLFGEIAEATDRWSNWDPGRYNPSTLVTARGMSVFDKMKLDDQIKAALAFKKHTVLANGFDVLPPEGWDEERPHEPTDFLRQQLCVLKGTMQRSLLGVLSSLDYGFSLCEKIFEEDGGRIILRALKPRRPHNFHFNGDRFGNVTAIVQRQTNGEVELPYEKFLHHVYGDVFGNPYGQSDLEAAHRAWFAKQSSYKWLMMLLERFGIPPVFALYNPDAYQDGNVLDKLKTIITRIQAATAGVIPRKGKDSLELWAPELAGQADKVFIPALDKFDQHMARAILMPGLLGFTSDGEEGSLARSQVHFDVFMLVVDFIRMDLTDVVQEGVVDQLIALNYGVLAEGNPRFMLNPLTDDLRLDVFDRWKNLLEAGAVKRTTADQDHIRKKLGFPSASEGEEMEDPAAEAEEELPGGDQDEPRENALMEYAAGEDATRERLDRLEARATARLRDALEQAQASMVRSVAAGRTPKFPNEAALRRAVFDSARATLDQGRSDLRRDAREAGARLSADHAADNPNFTPKDAIRWLRAKAFQVAGVVAADLTNKAKMAVLQGIRSGLARGAIEANIRRAFEPYLGDPTRVRDDKVVEPSRLENIVRTNTTEAYNQGRLTMFRDKDVLPLMRGVRYSSIMDQRTTPQCRMLHGRIIRKDDPALDRLAPPNHYQCRSILVPVTIVQTVDEKDYATAEEIGRALDETPEEFGGSHTSPRS